MLPEEQLLNALNSVEYAVYRHIHNANQAYIFLTNAESYEQAQDNLKMLQLSTKDALKQIERVLYVWGCPTDKIINVNKYTQDNMDNLWINTMHFYRRFLSASRENKAKELTALYFLVRDLAAIAETVKAEAYYTTSQERI